MGNACCGQCISILRGRRGRSQRRGEYEPVAAAADRCPLEGRRGRQHVASATAAAQCTPEERRGRQHVPVATTAAQYPPEERRGRQHVPVTTAAARRARGKRPARETPPLASSSTRRSALVPDLKANVLGYDTPNFRDKYTLGRKLGKGGFGTTYLCIEIATGAEYACKSIAKRKIINKEDVEEVRREIQIMHHLVGQQNVVALEGAYEDQTHVRIVMEFCAGGELADYIILRGHYSERKAAKLTRIIVGVVETCHSLGVMHRDLKLENFLLADKDDDMSLKVIDFGLSVFFKPGKSQATAGQIFTDFVGTPDYVAPEVVQQYYGPEVDVWSAGVILYILLSGYAPFSGDTKQAVFNSISKGVINFNADPWPVISDSAKQLVKKMLDPLPEKRPTAHEVLCHPWICEHGVAPDRPLDPAVLSRIKQFSAMNKLKKMALRVIAKRLSEQEIAGLKEMFEAMDTDRSGAITYDEMKEGMRKYDPTLNDTEILDLMEAADVDNSGTIDYTEFIAATLHLNKLAREEHLVAAFAYFDKDGSGYITVDELEQACKENNMSDAFLDEVIREADQNNDGQIDYGEFVAMMTKGNMGVGRRTI